MYLLSPQDLRFTVTLQLRTDSFLNVIPVLESAVKTSLNPAARTTERQPPQITKKGWAQPGRSSTKTGRIVRITVTVVHDAVSAVYSALLSQQGFPLRVIGQQNSRAGAHAWHVRHVQ
jgi:hypothetical protein